MIMDEKQMLELLDCSDITPEEDAGQKVALLIQAVAYLLETDFPRLCQILYRVDVDESMLKDALACPVAPPAEIIARLLLERQKQKVALRAKYTAPSVDIPEEEKW